MQLRKVSLFRVQRGQVRLRFVASGFGSTMIAISTGYSFKTNSHNGQTKSEFQILGLCVIVLIFDVESS